MSKIVYLFGAGASFGKRSVHNKNEILEGIPIVTEIPIQIDRLINRIKESYSYTDESPTVETSNLKKIIEELNWLKESSENHQTIDTYAKKLKIQLGAPTKEYNRLKTSLSIFLTLVQILNKPDSRYDAFFANILGDKFDKLPDNVSVLSWNYDCQFELAYKEYSQSKHLNDLWNELNISSKTTENEMDRAIMPFSITKLNGTALLYKTEILNHSSFLDPYYNEDKNESQIDYIYRTYFENLSRREANHAMSFAWENNTSKNFSEKYRNIAFEAEYLVIIGYSFPYFNREVDRDIIQRMVKLKKVYIQDPYCKDVKESFEAALSEEQLEKVESGQIKIILKESTKQFLIPNEM